MSENLYKGKPMDYSMEVGIMSGKRIIKSMKEALAISRGQLPKDTYKITIPKIVNGKARVD